MLIAVDFECYECGHIFEKYIVNPDQYIAPCRKCQRTARRIISFNTGHRADPTWLDSALELLQADGEKPIESRSEFDKYLKQHNIAQRC